MTLGAHEGDEGTEHPRWCDVERCTVSQGVGVHRSRAHQISIAGAATAVLEVSLWLGTAQPGEDTQPYVELVVSSEDHAPVEVDLTLGHAAALAWALRRLWTAARTAGPGGKGYAP